MNNFYLKHMLVISRVSSAMRNNLTGHVILGDVTPNIPSNNSVISEFLRQLDFLSFMQASWLMCLHVTSKILGTTNNCLHFSNLEVSKWLLAVEGSWCIPT